MKKIAIYAPAKVYGGTELLFLRLALFLQSKGIRVDVIDCNGGCISGISKEINVVFENDFQISNYSKIVLSAKYYRNFVCQFSEGYKGEIILWQLHPDEFCSYFFPYFDSFRSLHAGFFRIISILLPVFYRKRVEKLSKHLIVLEQTHCFWYMDGTNFFSTKNWLLTKNISIDNISFLPVVVKVPKVEELVTIKNTNEINALIVSRLSDDFKLYPILKVVELLAIYSEKNSIKITLNIVGNGNAYDCIFEYCKKYNIDVFFDVVMHGFMPIELVKSSLYPEANLAFAMGTSALDSASYGIPTIVIPALTNDIDSSLLRYRWLFNSKLYSLGDFFDFNSLDEADKKLFELLDEIKFEFKGIGNQSYEYVKAHHSDEGGFSKLVDRLQFQNEYLDHYEILKCVLNDSNKVEMYIESFFCMKRKIRKIYHMIIDFLSKEIIK